MNPSSLTSHTDSGKNAKSWNVCCSYSPLGSHCFLDIMVCMWDVSHTEMEKTIYHLQDLDSVRILRIRCLILVLSQTPSLFSRLGASPFSLRSNVQVIENTWLIRHPVLLFRMPIPRYMTPTSLDHRHLHQGLICVQLITEPIHCHCNQITKGTVMLESSYIQTDQKVDSRWTLSTSSTRRPP